MQGVSLLYLVYLIKVKPFEDPQLNTIEMFNELTFYSCCILCNGFTERAADPEAALNVGWLFIAICAVNVVTLLYKILSEMALKVYSKIATKCAKSTKAKIEDSKQLPDSKVE